MARISAFLAFLSLLPVLAAPVRGDDWLQFRHDATRSAVSKDSLHFPLKELWTWKTVGVGGHRPLYHTVIRKDLAYFTASERNRRFVICADAKTGAVKWRQPLEAERLNFDISDITGPAVTESGLVYVYDWASADTVLTTAMMKMYEQHFCTVDSFVVRTFDAMTGKEGPYFPMSAMGANGVLPRLSLMETPKGQEVNPVPPTFAGSPP